MAKLGYTLKTDDGKYQVSLYPPQQVNVTQGYGGTYSHRGTLNLDNASRTGMKDIAAPFDCRVVMNQYTLGFGIVIYHSINKVWTPSGLHHVTLVLMHDNNSERWKVGSTYKQGEHIYTEGDADPSGLTTGIHVHMETALGHHTQRIKSQPDGRYHIINQVKVEDVFFINGCDYITEEPGDGTQRPYFKKYKGSGVEPEPEKPEPEKPDKLKDIMPLYFVGVLKDGDFDG